MLLCASERACEALPDGTVVVGTVVVVELPVTLNPRFTPPEFAVSPVGDDTAMPLTTLSNCFVYS